MVVFNTKLTSISFLLLFVAFCTVVLFEDNTSILSSSLGCHKAKAQQLANIVIKIITSNGLKEYLSCWYMLKYKFRLNKHKPKKMLCYSTQKYYFMVLYDKKITLLKLYTIK